MDGEPQVLDTYYFFEDSEINQFNGKYYYSYCTNWGEMCIRDRPLPYYQHMTVHCQDSECP